MCQEKQQQHHHHHQPKPKHGKVAKQEEVPLAISQQSMDVEDHGPFSSLSTIAESLPSIVEAAAKVVEAGETGAAATRTGSGSGSGSGSEETTSMSSTLASSLSPSTSSCSDSNHAEKKQGSIEEEQGDATVCDDQPRRTVSPPPSPSSDASEEDKLPCPSEPSEPSDPSSSDPMTASTETATDANNKLHNLDGSSAAAVGSPRSSSSSSSDSKPTEGDKTSDTTNLKKRNFSNKSSSFASSSSSLVTSEHAKTNTTSTNTNTKHQRRTTTERKRRHRVSFTTVQIRRYPMLLGDNPAVLSGPPVGLGWEYEVLPEMPLVDFETFRLRSRRLHSNHLVLSHYKRLEIIQRNGHTAEEVKAVEKQIAKIKRQRNMTVAMTPLAPLQNIAESAGRKFKRSLSFGGSGSGSDGGRRR